jgi:hypothetical protein
VAGPTQFAQDLQVLSPPGRDRVGKQGAALFHQGAIFDLAEGLAALGIGEDTFLLESIYSLDVDTTNVYI